MKRFILTLILIGFTLTFSNNSNDTVYFYLFQLDHNFVGYNQPLNRAAGELNAGVTMTLDLEYEGTYFVMWSVADTNILKNTKVFTLDSDRTFYFTPPE